MSTFEERIQKRVEEVNAIWANAHPGGRDPERIERILGLVRKAWHTYPDQRLFQLLTNATAHKGDPFHIEDDELEAKLRTYCAGGANNSEGETGGGTEGEGQ